MDPQQRKRLERETKILRNLEKQLGPIRKMVSNPAFRQAMEASRIVAERDRALAQIPDMTTQRALIEAAKFFDSTAFRAQRDTLLQVQQVAQQRLGTEGLAAAQRIATRHSGSEEDYEQVIERMRSGEAVELLNEATRLASSQEVRETIESADKEALVRLDEEEAAEQGKVSANSTDFITELELYEDKHPEISKEQLLEMHHQALRLFLVLNAAVAAALVVVNPALSLPAILNVVTSLTLLLQ